ncbi:serine protease [Streptacidiphilus sp. N1-12]|uniref:Serine protease n=2 Tax=Streptacidiphilus alkalitolerans TaxID=3342712 RepID=A0ABV6WGX7_9ACTN
MSGRSGSRLSGIKARVVTGIALGAMLGGGAFVTASGAARASDSRPQAAQDQAQPTATASASASASAAPVPSAAASSAKPTSKAAAKATTAKSVSAPPRTSTGQSVTLAASQQPSQVGALFAGSIADGHHCTASVVDSSAGDIIVTAAHCLSSGTSTHTFVPGYRDGTAPYGVWQISQVLEDDAWTSSQDPDHDVAFAVVEPLNGQSLESVVGSYQLDTSGVTDTQVQITGYPSATDEPISCTGSSGSFSSSQLTVYCTGYAGGTSGSGWIEDYDPTDGSGTLVGVIGGYQTGGNTEDVSYAARFGDGVQALFNQAEAAG